MAKIPFLLLLLGCLALVGNAQSANELLLRNAILSPGASTVILTANVDLTANLPLLPKGKALTVIGKLNPGSGKVYIDGKKLYRIFSSIEGAVANPVNLTLRNLIIRGNPPTSKAAVYIGGEGSKILVSGVDFLLSNRAIYLIFVEGTIEKSTFKSHSEGAIELTSAEGFGKLLISACTFSNNARSAIGGGAIYGRKYDLITIKGSTFTANKAPAGGAIYFENTDGSIQSSKFTSNEATSGRGGAIFDIDTSVSVRSSTFEKNKALVSGGVISINTDGINPTVRFASSTFSKNAAVTSSGGVFELNEASYITFCSVSQKTFQGNTGKGVPNNGFSVGVGNRINTFPRATIPLVVGSPVTLGVQKCT